MSRADREAVLAPPDSTELLDPPSDPRGFEGLVAELWAKGGRVATGTVSAGEADLPPPPESRHGPVVAPLPNRFGRFQISEILGQGGGGIVLLAHDPKLDRDVAVKIPSIASLESRAARDRFLREGRAVSRLDHPQVVKVFDADDWDSIPFIVMEYCPEGSLADWLAARSTRPAHSPEWSARLVAGIADAIEHAHSKGIIHRDLKPSNILLASAGEGDEPALIGKVADFGLAKYLGDEGRRLDRTVQGHPLGTLPYMAPEAARGDGKAIGPGTDIYGLGAILFELLTGRPPLDLADRDELLGLVRDPAPAARPRHRPFPPAQLATICARCLAYSPEDRYRTAREVADELRRYLVGAPIRRRSRPLWDVALSWTGRHPISVVLAGLILIGLTAAGTTALGVRAWKEAKEIESVFVNIKAAQVADIPEVIAGLNVGDAGVAARLDHLFAAGTPTQKLASALARAGLDPSCGEHAYARLLRSEPREIAPIARALNAKVPGLVDRLAAEAATPAGSKATTAEAEAHDRRRANAATALIALGQGHRAWSLFRHSPDPQARSFLIHQLGPAGVDASRVADRLDSETDPSARLALLQALGEMPQDRWGPALHARLQDRVLELYEKDEHPGVHASAKWLAVLLGLGNRLAIIDRGLAAEKARPPGRGWRIGPLGMTFVTLLDGETGRLIELSDTEVTVEQFHRFRQGHKYTREISPEPDSPMNSVDACDSAAFCLFLSALDGIDPAETTYRRSDLVPLTPVADQLDRAGYRLPTDREFFFATRAGAVTPRHYGTTNHLLRDYAWCEIRSDLRTSPVARTKPNDFGLFDTLGNVHEICRSTRPGVTIQNMTALCGGAFVTSEHNVHSAAKYDGTSTTVRGWSDRNGFRVARTVHAR